MSSLAAKQRRIEAQQRAAAALQQQDAELDALLAKFNVGRGVTNAVDTVRESIGDFYSLRMDPNNGLFFLDPIMQARPRKMNELGVSKQDMLAASKLHPVTFNAMSDVIFHQAQGNLPVRTLDLKSRDMSPKLKRAFKTLLEQNGTDAELNKLRRKREDAIEPRGTRRRNQIMRVLVGDMERGYEPITGSFLGMPDIYVQVGDGTYRIMRPAVDAGHVIPMAEIKASSALSNSLLNHPKNLRLENAESNQSKKQLPKKTARFPEGREETLEHLMPIYKRYAEDAAAYDIDVTPHLDHLEGLRRMAGDRNVIRLLSDALDLHIR